MKKEIMKLLKAIKDNVEYNDEGEPIVKLQYIADEIGIEELIKLLKKGGELK